MAQNRVQLQELVNTAINFQQKSLNCVTSLTTTRFLKKNLASWLAPVDKLMTCIRKTLKCVDVTIYPIYLRHLFQLLFKNYKLNQ
jgi:hypothetical protein